jgi:hypothetical protein
VPYTTWDLGGCNCEGCDCYPCLLPEGDLGVTYDRTDFGGAVLSGAMVYQGGCSWQGSVVTGPGPFDHIDFSISCSEGCTYYTMFVPFSSTDFSVFTYDHPDDCSGRDEAGASRAYLIDAECSPLAIVLATAPGPPHVRWTIGPPPGTAREPSTSPPASAVPVSYGDPPLPLPLGGGGCCGGGGL